MSLQFLKCAVLLFTTTCAETTFDTCIVSESNACDLEDMAGPTFIYPGGNTRCAFDTNLEQGTNSTYRFEVYPGSGLNRNKVVMFFQGGGGCFSDATCDYSMQKSIMAVLGTFTFTMTPTSEVGKGIFNREEPLNPFMDWTVVVVTYCTADAHAGSRVKSGTVLDTHFNGIENTLSVWNWIETNLPTPETFVLSGTSAGSLAIHSWFNFILSRIDLTTTQVSVLLDSYVGYLPTSASLTPPYFGGCDERLELSDYLMTKCNAGVMTIVDLLQEGHEAYPTVPFAFISSKRDGTEQLFYCLALFGDDLFSSLMLLSSCISQMELLEGKFDILTSYITPTQENNIISYWSNSPEHGFLNKNKMYTENNGNGQEVSLVDWIKALVSDSRSSSIVPSYCTVGPDGVNPRTGTNFTQYCDTVVENAFFTGENQREKQQVDETSMDDSSLSARLESQVPLWIVTVVLWVCVV